MTSHVKQQYYKHIYYFPDRIKAEPVEVRALRVLMQDDE